MKKYYVIKKINSNEYLSDYTYDNETYCPNIIEAHYFPAKGIAKDTLIAILNDVCDVFEIIKIYV